MVFVATYNTVICTLSHREICAGNAPGPYFRRIVQYVSTCRNGNELKLQLHMKCFQLSFLFRSLLIGWMNTCYMCPQLPLEIGDTLQPSVEPILGRRIKMHVLLWLFPNLRFHESGKTRWCACYCPLCRNPYSTYFSSYIFDHLKGHSSFHSFFGFRQLLSFCSANYLSP